MLFLLHETRHAADNAGRKNNAIQKRRGRMQNACKFTGRLFGRIT
jgi:hypothetical protein